MLADQSDLKSIVKYAGIEVTRYHKFNYLN